MAKRKKSSLLGKHLKAHNKDETNYGMEFIDLPAGITGGIAKLVDAKVGVYKTGDNEGEQFLYLGGVVVEPKVVTATEKVFQDGKVVVLSVREVDIAGQRTSKMVPLCETSKQDGTVVTQDENVSTALNELRKLGGEGCTENVNTDEQLLEFLEDLKGQGVYFKFSTSARDPSAAYPTQRVWENWLGAKDLEDYEPEEDEDIDDDTEDPDDDKPEEDDPEPDDDDEDDEEDPEDDDDDDDWAPEKGESYNFKPPKARKFVEVKVTAVFSSKETCNVMNVATEKIYKGVSWDKLSGDDD